MLYSKFLRIQFSEFTKHFHSQKSLFSKLSLNLWKHFHSSWRLFIGLGKSINIDLWVLGARWRFWLKDSIKNQGESKEKSDSSQSRSDWVFHQGLRNRKDLCIGIEGIHKEALLKTFEVDQASNCKCWSWRTNQDQGIEWRLVIILWLSLVSERGQRWNKVLSVVWHR
jgi:hypothetical protein